MLSRRELVSGAFVGWAGVPAPGAGDAAAAAQGTDPRDIKSIASDLSTLVQQVRTQTRHDWPGSTSASVSEVRARFEQFMRSNGRFPQFLDVGYGVYQDIYDWHVRFGQQLTSGRTPDGRYAIVFQYTQLILRPEGDASYVGLPYDER
ncbi:MAG: hypothetical protein AB7O67_21585 [Vicinamibacterales bacterium]